MTVDPFGPHALAVVATTGVTVLICVLLHYESFALLTRGLSRMHLHVRRLRILLLIYALIALHVAEIWLFGIAYQALALQGDFGSSVSAASGLLDFVYFSATVYTTLGFGDLVPTGAVRFLRHGGRHRLPVDLLVGVVHVPRDATVLETRRVARQS